MALTREIVATIAVPTAYPAKMSNIAFLRMPHRIPKFREFLSMFCAGRHIQREKWAAASMLRQGALQQHFHCRIVHAAGAIKRAMRIIQPHAHENFGHNGGRAGL